MKLSKKLLSVAMALAIMLTLVPAEAFAQGERGVARAGSSYQETVTGVNGKCNLKYYLFAINGTSQDSVVGRIDSNVSGTLTATVSITYRRTDGGTSTNTSAPATSVGLSCSATEYAGNANATTSNATLRYTSNGYGNGFKQLSGTY